MKLRQTVWILGSLVCLTLLLEAGSRREVEDRYVQYYKNKAMFLKIPIRGARQIVFVTDTGPVLDRSNAAAPLAFKVGDQVRITDVNFRGDNARFRISSVDVSRDSEILFQYPGHPGDDPQYQAAFDRALEGSFTEGLSYTEIDAAKEQFIRSQFDHLIQQFATTTGTSREYVIQAISEQNPEYRAAKTAAEEARARVQALEEELRRESAARRQGQTELTTLRRELDQARTALGALQGERDQVASERETAQQQLTQAQTRAREFENRARDYERQVGELVKNLDLHAASSETLGRRLEALTSERATLSERLSQVSSEVETLRRNNQQLSEQLKTTEERRSRLEGDLRALTSDKDSLQANFLETRRQKELLERTEALQSSLRLQSRLENREEGKFQIADLYLLNHKIGQFEVQVPEQPGKVYPVRFTVNSPDTVEFGEEARRLYRALGEKFQVAAEWHTSSDSLKALLLGEEPLQSLGPRESTEWRWSFTGGLDQPQRVVLRTHLVDEDGQKIMLADQEFMVNPTGVLFWLRQSFSLVSLLAGILLATGVFTVVWGLRGLSRSPSRGQQKSRDTRSRVAAKPQERPQDGYAQDSRSTDPAISKKL